MLGFEIMAAQSPLRVGMPLYTGCTLLDFAGATQIFALGAGYKVDWLAPTLDPITTTEKVQVLPRVAFADATPYDILFIPGGGSAVGDVMQDATYVDFLRAFGSQAGWAGSVCTGAFLVAAAGLFDGHEATTYWSQLDNFRLFSRITVPPGYPRWVLSDRGPGNRRFSGGGISSSIDLALELVNRVGGEVASETAQLANQYAPAPPYDAGDPSTAPPAVTAAVLASQASFTAAIHQATCAVTQAC
jgi:cyclohexyl-isocyanide hydratase